MAYYLTSSLRRVHQGEGGTSAIHLTNVHRLFNLLTPSSSSFRLSNR